MSRIEEALRKAEEVERRKRKAASEGPAEEPAAPPEEDARPLRPAPEADEREVSRVPATRTAEGRPVRARAARRSARAREFYDKIRASILLALPDQRTRALVVCSSLRTEGTTTTVVHLGLSLAEQGPTLLVDANLNHPELHRYFQVEQRPGLAEYLAGRAALDEIVVRTTHPNLGVVILGNVLPETPAQLCSERLRTFLADVQGAYDSVLLDTAPLDLSAETPLCAAMTDGVVLVVRAGRTRREIVQHSTEVIHNASARCVGVVLNQMRFPIPSVVYERL